MTTALTWDVTSSLVESNGQGGHVFYSYDASGNRVLQVRVADANGPGTATGYVASGQVDDANTAATSTDDVTATRYYTFGGSTVAIRADDGQLSLMLGDEQGSTNVMMPVTVEAGGALASATLADAALVTRTAYTPYGELRGADNLATDRGWLGQVEDRVEGASGTGLTYLNARYYDPATSRFISPDPLINPADPRTLDAYMYSSDNPVAYTDASGMRQDVGGLALNDTYYSDPKNKDVSTFTGVTKNGSEGGGLNGGLRGRSIDGSLICDWMCVGKRNADYKAIQDFLSTAAANRPQQDEKPVDRSVNGPEGIPGPSWADFWRGLRFFKNAGFLADPLGSSYGWGVYGLAKAGGADCGYYSEEAMMVCAGAPWWLHGRGGTMHSFVYVTSDGAPTDSSESDLSYVLAETRTLAHEAKHMDQFAIFGAVPFGLLYADASFQEVALTPVTGKSHPAECNVIERWAGFADGKYYACAAG